MVEVRFYDRVDDHLLQFAVIIAQTRGKWVFCKHRERDTYEVPGGHREQGEASILSGERPGSARAGRMRPSACCSPRKSMRLNHCTVR